MRPFVNAQPEVMSHGCPAESISIIADGQRRLRPVLEVTERALTRDPSGLLGRSRPGSLPGWGIALDDVGAEPASLALMPFLEPDVNKLDLRLVQDRTDSGAAEIANAVIAHAERSGG